MYISVWRNEQGVHVFQKSLKSLSSYFSIARSNMKLCEHVTNGGVSHIYVEYQGKQGDVSQSSGSDFE
jgi:hypothetical protein